MKVWTRTVICVTGIILLLNTIPLSAQNLYEAQKDTARVPRQPYFRYFTKDKYQRRITFYISKSDSTSRLPLIVYVQGSGDNSNFRINNDRLIPVNGHIYINESLQDKARLLIVEKPGVKYLDSPDAGESMKNTEFNEQHSLERWAEAIKASIKACIRSGLADSSKILVIGHSEGGLVACKVTADLGTLVTHVAVMAGGGDSQLYDILVLARKGTFFKNVSDDSAARVQYVLDEWKKILADPLNAGKFFFGFSYLRWSSFMQTSCLEQLQNYNGKIFIAQGLEDKNLDPASADQLYAHLLSKNKDVTFDRLENADHEYNDKNNPGFNGWKAEMQKAINWFLSN